jgi:hypothetical protein
MKKSRLEKEQEYLVGAVKNRMQFLQNRPELLEDFLDFVRESTGVTPIQMMPRLRMTWSGRPPTSLMIATLQEYFQTGRHLGAVIAQSGGRTIIAPAEDVERLGKLIGGLKCSHLITGCDLRRNALGWFLTIALLEDPDQPTQMETTDNIVFTPKIDPMFEDFPRIYAMSTGHHASVMTHYACQYHPLDVPPEEGGFR